MSDDGLKAPDGYEIEHPIRLIDCRRAGPDQAWLNNSGEAQTGPTGALAPRPDFGYLRIALRKLPGRRLLNLSEAVKAHQNANIIRCEGEPSFEWLPHTMYPRAYGMAAVPLEWLIDRTDFYVHD